MLEKVIVIGCSGSGKSTFSIKLAQLTKLPLFHLDNIWWRNDKTHIERSEFDQKLSEIMQGDKWIIDGDYSRTYEVRIKEANTIIFLDFPLRVCLDGIKKRVGTKRSDIPFLESELDPELINQVNEKYSKNRSMVYLLKEKYQSKEWIIFNSHEEVDNWLNNLEESLCPQQNHI